MTSQLHHTKCSIALPCLLLFSLLLCVGGSLSASTASPEVGSHQVLFAWKHLNFTFESVEEMKRWEAMGGYKNCMLAGVKQSHAGEVFVSVPRGKPNVPATLARLVLPDPTALLSPTQNATAPLLEPFPSWEMNREGDVHALQSVLGFEIDSQDRIWILDQGHINNAEALPGSIKLLVYKIATKELLYNYTFTADEAPLGSSFLNDIVVDEKRGYAYITDSGQEAGAPYRGALLVYSAATNTVRRVLDSHYSQQPNASVWIHINGQPVDLDTPMMTGSDGIALTPDGDWLFFCPLTSREIYRLPTALLRQFETPESTLASSVVHVFSRRTASDGLAIASDGKLYLTGLEIDGLEVAPSPLNSTELTTFVTDRRTMIWPDTIGFDHNGWLLFVSNRLQQFTQGFMVWSDVNFRIVRVFIDAGSYLD